MQDPRQVYQLANKLGKGAFATVYLGIQRDGGQRVAVKRVRLDKPDADIEACRREVLALTRIDTPFITAIYGAYVTGKQLWIMMEHMDGGSVDDLIKANGPLPDDAIARILFCATAGLAYMHARQQVHRDIKPDNILLKIDGNAKLCDLGVSYDVIEDIQCVDDQQTPLHDSNSDPKLWLPKIKTKLSSEETSTNKFVGTPFYMAPEVIEQKSNGPTADMWSLGIATIEMATAKCPRADFHPMKAMMLTRQEPPPKFSHTNSKLVDVVQLCLQKDPLTRASASALLEHKFLKSKRKKVPKQLVGVIQLYLDKTSGEYSSGSEDDEDEYDFMGIDHSTEPWDF